jgi:hypothetical protein
MPSRVSPWHRQNWNNMQVQRVKSTLRSAAGKHHLQPPHTTTRSLGAFLQLHRWHWWSPLQFCACHHRPLRNKWSAECCWTASEGAGGYGGAVVLGTSSTHQVCTRKPTERPCVLTKSMQGHKQHTYTRESVGLLDVSTAWLTCCLGPRRNCPKRRPASHQQSAPGVTASVTRNVPCLAPRSSAAAVGVPTAQQPCS